MEKVGERVVTSDEHIADLFHVVQEFEREHVGPIVHRKIRMYKIVFAFLSPPRKLVM